MSAQYWVPPHSAPWWRRVLGFHPGTATITGPPEPLVAGPGRVIQPRVTDPFAHPSVTGYIIYPQGGVGPLSGGGVPAGSGTPFTPRPYPVVSRD